MERMWWAYDAKSTANPFGRESLGPCGWHDNASSALAAAVTRYPERDASAIQVASI